MFGISRDTLEYLKETYKPGTRVVCNYMSDPYHPVPTGTKGTVRSVDDMGTIHVSWDNGSSLGIVAMEDSCSVIES